jgi:hypothetical protein
MKTYQFLFSLLIWGAFIHSIFSQSKLHHALSSGGGAGNAGNIVMSYTFGQAIQSSHVNLQVSNLSIGFQQFLDSTGILPPPLNKYNIGEIPNQIVYFKTSIQFEVYSKELGDLAILTIEPNGEQKGTANFRPETGHFEYIPDSLDLKSFTIDFIAAKELDTIRQRVLFNCIAHLPQEQVVFGIGNNLFIPDSLDKDYIIENVINNPGVELFNNLNRPTRNISLIGKTIVFEEDHKSGFFNRFHKNSDLKKLTIYAQTLIINSPLELPQTEVTIFAENIVFSNNGSISVKPEKNEQNANLGNGKDGMDLSEMRVYIKNFKSPSGIRFFLNGGDGQDVVASTNNPNPNPGSGGKGGILISNINLKNFVDFVGGNPGGGGNKIAERGMNGKCEREWNSEYKWLHPFWLRILLKYSKDTYLEGNLIFTVASIERYDQEINDYADSEQWDAADTFIKAELQQIDYEINAIINRVSSNLDYFGNPAGWTPMLSFEANKTIYENEIERSIRTMYLAYWLKNSISTLEQRVLALSHARDELAASLENNISGFNVLTELIPALEDEIEEISIQSDRLQQELILVEKSLEARAQKIVKDRNKVSSWKKFTSMAGQIMQVIPAYQPALGSIGTALSEISNYDPGKSFLQNLENFKDKNLSELFKKENFQASTQEIDQFLKTIDPKAVKDAGSAKEYASNLASLAKSGQKKYNEILGIIKKEQQVPKDEIEVVLSNLKASDPTFNRLADEIAVLLAQKESLINKILNTNDNIQKLNSEVKVSLLGMDGLNRDISSAESVLDDRVKVYLDDMENRAKERLLKYHYFMNKAYEFRMVKPYPQTLNIQNLFDRFKEIAEASNSSSILSENQFLSLKSIYEDQIAKIAEQIFTEYNQNQNELSAPLRFSLSEEQLNSLNSGSPVVINLVEMGLFQPNEENIRIFDFGVYSMNIQSTGPLNNNSFFDLEMEHSGISKLRKNGNTFLFRNYNNRTTNPIRWGCRYSRISNSIDKIDLSFASQSLLTTMMSIKGIPTNGNNILLYSRPAAWADIVITKAVHPNSTSVMVIDSLVLELRYDFTRMPSNLVAYNISSTDNLKPLIEINRKDNNNRQNGYGSINRVFNRSSSQQLRVSVPKTVDSYLFDKWTDPNGNDLGGIPFQDTSINISLNFGNSIKANYILINPILGVSTDEILVSQNEGDYTFEVENKGNGELDWRIESQADWIIPIGELSGINNSLIQFSVQPLGSEENRVDTIYVISENSMNFIEKIVIIQDKGSSLPPWEKLITDAQHTIIIPENVISDVAGDVLKSGDFIGVFFERDGEFICSDFVEWNDISTTILAYGNELISPQKNGFNASETLNFKLWRSIESKEYELQVSFEDPPIFPRNATGKWKGNGLSLITSLQTAKTNSQSIPLRESWNMISSYVLPDNSNMLDIMDQLKDKVVLIKDETGKSTIPEFGINNIGNWNVTKGYQIKVTEPTNLTISGSKVNINDTQIELGGKWEIISFFCENPNTPSNSFNSIMDNIFLVKDQDGMTYIPEFGIDGIKCLVPGRGYQIRTKSSGVLKYNCEDDCFPTEESILFQGVATDNLTNGQKNTGNNATIIIPINIVSSILQIGDTLFAYNGEGAICGRATYEGESFAFPVWGDDLSTEDYNEGYAEGESFYFIAKKKNGERHELTLNFDQEGKYIKDGVFVLQGLSLSSKVKITESKIHVYPNPASDLLNVEISCRDCGNRYQFRIIDYSGKLIEEGYIQELIFATTNSIQINTSNLSPGLYILVSQIGQNIFQSKFSVIK